MSRRPGRPDPNQLPIAWEDLPAVSRPATILPGTPDVSPPPPKPAGLVQQLGWDFKDSFPDPLPDALGAGTLDASDATPEGLRSLHEACAETARAALCDRDRLSEARRSGTDPVSGRRPKTAVGRERLRKALADAPERQERAFDALLLTYADAFGVDAADAFAKALNARHAGVEVIADEHPRPRNADVPAPAEACQNDPPGATRPHRPRRSPTSLPVPKPLRSAVRSGAFGRDDDGRPVSPSPAEVRAITEQHAEKLAELLGDAERSPANGQAAGAFEDGIRAYTADFGTPAAARLRGHVRRLAQREGRGRSR